MKAQTLPEQKVELVSLFYMDRQGLDKNTSNVAEYLK
jgi:hypothetical protein